MNLLIDGEHFETHKDYQGLVDRVWIHSSLCYEVAIINCSFSFKRLSFLDRINLNKDLGFCMFSEDIIVYDGYTWQNQAVINMFYLNK